MPDAAPQAASTSPLAAFAGARPPAPDWYDRAVAHAPERGFTEVEGVAIETLVWGERGRPGLLLVHGGGAHADWWTHIAPFFRQDWRVAALSLSGAGGSGWRTAYDVGQFGRELVVVARAEGLYEAGAPVFLAHSFGSRAAYAALAGARPQDLPRLLIVADAALSPDGSRDNPEAPARPANVYPSLPAALARFRLMPPQACANPFLVDAIARASVREVEGGWSWRFDPFFWERLRQLERAALLQVITAPPCPLAFVYGENSYIVGSGALAFTRDAAPAGTPCVAVPDAAHHLFLDQPLAFVSAVRALLAVDAR